MSSERRFSPKVFERFRLPKPQPVKSERTLFVENAPGIYGMENFPPKLLAHHLLRSAVQAGCEKINIKRGRWRYEFKVQDLCPKDKIVICSSLNKLETLGISAFKMKLAGSEFDEVKDPQAQVVVRPPWKQPGGLATGE